MERSLPFLSQQEVTRSYSVALKVFEVPGPADQKIWDTTSNLYSYSYGEKPIISYQQELPDANEKCAFKRFRGS